MTLRIRPTALVALLAPPMLLAGPARAADPVAVTITDKGCQPATLTVAAGKTTFRV